MQNDFVVNELNVDKKNKSILINFAFDIDLQSVSYQTVQLINRKTKEIVDYTPEQKGKQLKLVLNNWPKTDEDYIVKIDHVKNILGEELIQPIKKVIKFPESICSKVEVISPSLNEEISEINITLKEEPINTDQIYNSYYIEISTENVFYNIVSKTLLKDKNSITLKSLPDKQYYIRARIETEDDYSDWSPVNSFIVKNKEVVIENEEDMKPVFIKPIQMLAYPEQGITPNSFLFEFDCPIDSDFLDQIIIIRKDV